MILSHLLTNARSRPISRAALLWVTVCSGCAPSLLPDQWLVNRTEPDGSIRRVYDTTGDGRGDYAEQQAPDGRIRVIHFDTNRDGELDEHITLADLDPQNCRDLLIILDSVPFSMVRDAWNEGRFRLFHPPSRVISPFPVMTDLSMNELFKTSPAAGIDARYFDGQRMTNGYITYMAGENSAWLDHVDYHMSFINHGYAYLNPWSGYRHELRRIEQIFMNSKAPAMRGYSVGTSAIGSIEGRSGHERILMMADRYCRALMKRTRGRIRITLMSDHGHNLVYNKPLPLHDILAEHGFHDGTRLEHPGDIVVPRFGPVTCAGIYTREPDRVAADVSRITGVELVFYQEAPGIVVLSPEGRAIIDQQDGRYRYRIERGDPLELQTVITALEQQGKLDARGFAADRDWFTATAEHRFPDPLQRLWRAFHGLLKHTPQVLVSLEDGYCHGTSFFDIFIKMESAHGSLRANSSHGFVMSTAESFPDPIRMEDFARYLPP